MNALDTVKTPRGRAHLAIRSKCIATGLHWPNSAALADGIGTVCAPRLLYGVLAYERIRLVHAVKLRPDFLDKTPRGFDALPCWGPTPLGLRAVKAHEEQTSATLQALGGIPGSVRPATWIACEPAVSQGLKVAQKRSQGIAKHLQSGGPRPTALSPTQHSLEGAVDLPRFSRNPVRTAFLDTPAAQRLAVIPLERF